MLTGVENSTHFFTKKRQEPHNDDIELHLISHVMDFSVRRKIGRRKGKITVTMPLWISIKSEGTIVVKGNLSKGSLKSHSTSGDGRARAGRFIAVGV